MDDWKKESLGLKIGDWIIWRDEEIKAEGGPSFVSPGMKGKVLSLHDGAHLDMAQGSVILPRAVIELKNGMRLVVDQRMQWQKISGSE